MTLPEITEYITVIVKNKESKFKEQAILLDGLSRQLISGLNMLKPKVIPLKQLYPDVFGNKKAENNISPERKEKITVNTWKTFLGV